MTGAMALLFGSAVVGLYGHRPLLWLADRRLDPTILLTGWLLSTVGLIVSTVATISLFALPADEHPASGIFRLAGGCWTALSSGSLPGWREGLAALGVIGAATILLRIGWAVSVRRRRRRKTAPHVEQLRLLAAGAPSGDPLWVRDDRPLAMSIGGRPGVIVMSDSLRHHLTPGALAATLEHERAHLRGRHHLLVALVGSLAAPAGCGRTGGRSRSQPFIHRVQAIEVAMVGFQETFSRDCHSSRKLPLKRSSISGTTWRRRCETFA